MFEPMLKIEDLDNDNISIIARCPDCLKDSEAIIVNKTKWEGYYQRGWLIQNVFPELTPDQRERLITGICQFCWGLLEIIE